MPAKLKIAAASTDPYKRARDTAIEITPEMIEAGVRATVPFEDLFEDPEKGVQKIFNAMATASPRG